jgi:hypothetical protein
MKSSSGRGAGMAGSPPVSIHPLELGNRRQLKKFIKFPWKIYRDDPNWVPPLIFDQLQFFTPGKNPYFSHSKAQLFMAFSFPFLSTLLQGMLRMANPDLVEGPDEARAMPWLSCNVSKIPVATVCGEMIKICLWGRRRLAHRPGRVTPSGSRGPRRGSMPRRREDCQSA